MAEFYVLAVLAISHSTPLTQVPGVPANVHPFMSESFTTTPLCSLCERSDVCYERHIVLDNTLDDYALLLQGRRSTCCGI